MRIETKLDLGQVVFAIRSEHHETWVRCGFCDATAVVTGADGRRRHCPDCGGRGGRAELLPQAWRVVGQMTVGQIRVEVTGSDAGTAREREDRAMLVETGIGTGTLWSADDLFDTEDTARVACELRNASTVTA